MTRTTVIQKITSEMLIALQTEADSQAVIERYIGLALDIGCNHFHPEQIEVWQIDSDDIIIDKFNSFTDASKKTGIPRGNIQFAAQGKLHSAGGYTWKQLNY